MVKLSQRKNLFASFGIIFCTAVALYVIENAEIFRRKAPEINNKEALIAYEACKQFGTDCACQVLEKCAECPEQVPVPWECQGTGRREYMSCSPGGHEFYRQCTSTQDEARQHFWGYYMSSAVLLVGSCIVVNHRKQFLDRANSARQADL